VASRRSAPCARRCGLADLIIRPATPDDVLALLLLARDLHAQAPHYRDLPYDESWAAARAWAAVATGAAFVLTFEDTVVGMLLCAVEVCTASRRHRCCDVVRYIAPGFRGRGAHEAMLTALEAWGRANGCAEAIVTDSCEDDRPVAARDRYYARRGWAPLGRIYTKALKTTD